jgi:hypothetical protein
MTEHLFASRTSFQHWNDCDYAVFYSDENGKILYANHQALKWFALSGYPAIKNIGQVPSFRFVFENGLATQKQNIEWVTAETTMIFTLLPDPITGHIGFFAAKPEHFKTT